MQNIRRWFNVRRLGVLVLPGLAVALSGANAGCQETAAATTAVAAAQTTAAVLEQVPKWVQDLVAATQRDRGWGKPEAIYVTDYSYVYIFPTSAAEKRKNGGAPRMIVIDRNDVPQPL